MSIVTLDSFAFILNRQEFLDKLSKLSKYEMLEVAATFGWRQGKDRHGKIVFYTGIESSDYDLDT